MPYLWVPVTVVQNDNVGSGQVDAQAASSRREEEAELFAAWRVKDLHSIVALVALGVAINAAVTKALCTQHEEGDPPRYVQSPWFARGVTLTL